MNAFAAWGVLAWSEVAETPAGDAAALPVTVLPDTTGPMVLIAEIEIYKPVALQQQGAAWSELAWSEISLDGTAPADAEVIRASDSGYVTRASDPVGMQVYPPIMLSGVEADRAMDLAPNGVGAGAAWGTLRLADDGSLAALVGSRNADGRPFSIRLGRRTLLPHGVWRDPAWNQTAVLLGGIGGAWRHATTEVRLDLRDPTYWLDRPMDGAAYAGTGGLEGPESLTGKRKPILRGGTADDPVREIAPVLVDATLGIYQVSDAGGAVTAVYERGLGASITDGGPVADITATGASAGQYVHESSARGLFIRLGTFPPAGQITLDAWGDFPSGASASTPGDLALALLREDAGVPEQFIHAASFTGLGAAFPHPCGIWLGPDEATTGAELLGHVMRSAGARIVPQRDGSLGAVALRALAAGWIPAASYGPETILDCAPAALPADVTPPPYRIRVGYQRFHTLQTSDLAPTLSGERIQALAEEWRIAAEASSEVLAAWRRPSDPDVVRTALTDLTGAEQLATLLAELWCVPQGRQAWDVTLPLPYALRHEPGEAIYVTWPGPLAAGVLCRIVGERIRSGEGIAILTVIA